MKPKQRALSAAREYNEQKCNVVSVFRDCHEFEQVSLSINSGLCQTHGIAQDYNFEKLKKVDKNFHGKHEFVW